MNCRINLIDVNGLLAASLPIICGRLQLRSWLLGGRHGLSHWSGLLPLPVIDRVNNSDNKQNRTSKEHVELLPVLKSKIQKHLPRKILDGSHVGQHGEVQADEIGVILARSQSDRVNNEYVVAALKRINELHNIRVGSLHGESDLDLEQS